MKFFLHSQFCFHILLSRCGYYSPHPSQNRTCAINAYSSSSYIRAFALILNTPFAMFSAIHVRTAASYAFKAVRCVTLPSICFHRLLRYYDDIGLPDKRLAAVYRLILSTLSGYVRTSAVPITHLREPLFTSTSASPCSQTWGCLTDLALSVSPVLSAVNNKTSTSSH